MPQPALTRVVHDLTAGAGWLALLTMCTGALVVAVCDWPVGSTFVGTAIGAALWGALHFFTQVHRYVPEEEVEAAPADLEITRPRLSLGHIWVVVGLALTVPLAWLADRWDLGAVFVPGQFAGAGLASALGAIVARRWEARHDADLVRVTDPTVRDDDGRLAARSRAGAVDNAASTAAIALTRRD